MKTNLMKITLAGAIALLAGWQTSPIMAKPTVQVATNEESLGDSMQANFQKEFFALIHPSEVQQEKLIAIFGAAKASNDPIRAAIKEKSTKLLDAFADDSTSDDQFKQQVTEVNALKRQMMDNRLEAAIKARAVMTVEQRKLIKDRLTGWLAQS